MDSKQQLKKLRMRLTGTRMQRDREIQSYVGVRALCAVDSGKEIDVDMVRAWRTAALNDLIVIALKSQLVRLEAAVCGLEARIEYAAHVSA